MNKINGILLKNEIILGLNRNKIYAEDLYTKRLSNIYKRVKMKKQNIIIFSTLVLMTILLASSFVTPFWPFTGRAIDDSGCKESDSGNNPFVAGIARTETREGMDSCNLETNKLREYYCENGKVKKSKPILCRWGCDSDPVYLDDQDVGRGWRCKPQPSSCEDTDQKDTSRKGVTKDIKGRYEDSCSDDEKSVLEYICDANNEALKTEISCQYGCDNGRCKGEPRISCEDTDPAEDDPKLAGVVRTMDKEGQSDYYIDTCEGANIKEYSCNSETGKNIPKLIACEGKCETKAVSAFGKEFTVAYCDPKPLSCTDTDSEAPTTIEVKGTATASDIRGDQTSSTDVCLNTKTLTEYYCREDKIGSDNKECSDICSDGRCLVRDAKCSDTDAGKDYAVEGTVTTQFGAVTDFCADTNLLAEFGCKEGKKLVQTSKTSAKISVIYKKCNTGCNNGACIGQSSEDSQGVLD